MAERLARNLRAEYLSCRICLDLYKDPRRLACDHIFCQGCLVSHARQTHVTRDFRNFIACPLCRQEIEVFSDGNFIAQEWVTGLPTDTLILSLIQTLNQHNKTTPRRGSTDIRACAAHDRKPCDAYCFTHAQLICWQCAAVDHKQCQTDSVDNAFKKVEPEIETLKETVRKQISRAQDMCRNDREFDESRVQAFKDIETVRERLTEVYNSAVRQLGIIKGDIERCNGQYLEGRREFYSLVIALFELEATLKDGESATLLELFPSFEREVTKSETLLGKIGSMSGSKKVVFKTDAKVKDMLMNFTSVGFLDMDGGAPNDATGGTLGSVPSSIVDSTPSSIAHILQRGRKDGSEQRETTPIDISRSRGSSNHQRLQIDFSALSDKEEGCHLNGIITFPNNAKEFCVLDRENEKIKKFNVQGVLVDFLELSGPPHDATLIEPSHDICVTQPDERLVTVVASGDMTLKRYVPTSIPYNGICQKDDESLVVSSWSVFCVDIINMHGRVLRHFSKDAHAHEFLCDFPDLLCALPNGKIAMTDVGNTLTCICPESVSQHGNLTTWHYTAPERIYGVCADSSGDIYACVKDKNEIRTISSEGGLKQAGYITEEDGVIRPISIGLLPQCLVVAEEGDRIKIFHL